MSNAHWRSFAALYVMSINYETWTEYRRHRTPFARRIALKSKTLALIAYDHIMTGDPR